MVECDKYIALLNMILYDCCGKLLLYFLCMNPQSTIILSSQRLELYLYGECKFGWMCSQKWLLSCVYCNPPKSLSRSWQELALSPWFNINIQFGSLCFWKVVASLLMKLQNLTFEDIVFQLSMSALFVFVICVF